VTALTCPCHGLAWQRAERRLWFEGDVRGRFPSPFPLLFHLRLRRTVCAGASTDSALQENPPSCGIACAVPSLLPVPGVAAHPLLSRRDGPGSRWKRVLFSSLGTEEELQLL